MDRLILPGLGLGLVDCFGLFGHWGFCLTSISILFGFCLVLVAINSPTVRFGWMFRYLRWIVELISFDLDFGLFGL